MQNSNNAVTVVRSFAHLQLHRDPLEALLDRYPHVYGFYYRWGWMETLNTLYLCARESLFFVLFWRDGTLIGVAPLQLEHKRLHHAGVRRLHFYGGISGPLTNLYGDLLVPAAGDLEPCVAALRELLYGAERDAWDMLDLRCIAADSAALPHLRRYFPGLAVREEGMRSFVTQLPDTFAQFAQAVDRPFFKEILRREKRLREQHADVQLLHTTTLSAAQRAAICTVHSRRQHTLNERGGHRDAVFDDPHKRAAVLRLLDEAETRRCGWHFLLTVEGRIAAFLLGFRYRSALIIYLIGFDGTYDRYGPCKQLMKYMYECAIAEPGIGTVNWGPGNSEYKFKWCNRITENYNLELFNTAHWPSRLRLAARARLMRLTAAARRRLHPPHAAAGAAS